MGIESKAATVAFKADFKIITGTLEEKLTSLVAVQQHLINVHNKEGYEHGRWYTYYRPRFQAVGRQIATLKKNLSKDSPSLSDIIGDGGKVTGEKEYNRDSEKKKIDFADKVEAVDLSAIFIGEDPTKNLPDPYENFNNYTEVDADGDVSIGDGSSTGSKVTVDTILVDAETYVYKDCGVGHFNYFEHKFQSECTVHTITSRCNCYAAANGVGTENAWTSAVFCIWQGNYLGGPKIVFQDRGAGWKYDGSGTLLMFSTAYFFTVDRDGLDVNLYIRTGSHSGTLVDTLTITQTSTKKYRYIYCMAGRGSDLNGHVSFTVQDLDLQDERIIGVINPAKIMGVAVADIKKVMGVE